MGGDGLARLPDGRAVFVPDVIPGEQVLVRVVEDNQKYARAEVIRVEQASPLRILPPLPAFWGLRRLPLPAHSVC